MAEADFHAQICENLILSRYTKKKYVIQNQLLCLKHFTVELNKSVVHSCSNLQEVNIVTYCGTITPAF